jgi:diguanylate cyclase (GGDEF)-like protein
MEVSAPARHPRSALLGKEWPWWRLPGVLRAFVAFVPIVAIVLLVVAARESSWSTGNLMKFLLLVVCGLISVASTPRMAYAHSGMVRDFITVWVLPVAILLPPVYALLAPVPLLMLTQWYVHKGVLYRRVFTGAALGLSYGVASYVFHAYPASFAGPNIGTGAHALTWVLAVASCELIGWLGHHVLIVTAVKLTDPTARIADLELNREALNADLAQVDLGILITIAVVVNPILAIVGLPTVLLVRRFLVHAALVAQARTDSKTGLLNVSTWEREAESEVSRALRTRSPLSIALLDIDHFKAVNDTYGHLVGDRVLRALTDALSSQLRDYDRAGRFGGEEFVVLLPQTTERDAHRIAERLRAHIAELRVPVDDREDASVVRLTVSVGVAGMDGTEGELTALLAAADAALYYAKETGRNRTHVFAAAGAVPAVSAVPSQVNGHAVARKAAGLVRWRQGAEGEGRYRRLHRSVGGRAQRPGDQDRQDEPGGCLGVYIGA